MVLPRIPVLHDAEGVVVVDEPPGLETTGRTLDDPRAVQHRLARQLGRPVWAAHQLDRDTSGVSKVTCGSSPSARACARRSAAAT